MKRMVDFLAPLGLALIVGSRIADMYGKLPGRSDAWLLGGAALILAQILLRWEDLAGLVGRRQMRYGANTFVLILVVLGILGAANYLVNRHTKRWDLTQGQRYSLSDQTKKVVQALKEDVRIWYFQRAGQMERAQDRLSDYQALSPHFKVEFIDPIVKPAKAREHEVTTLPALVLERGTKREKIGNDSEQDITNALIKVTREAKKTVCFAEGEGERDIEDSTDKGYSAAKAALAKTQYETQKVLLMREGKVPESCSVLVVAGPEKDLLPSAVEPIRNFIKAGGKALVLEEPEIEGASFPNLTALLKEWNIEAGKDVVLDVSLQSQLAGTGAMTPLAARYPYHEITKDFRLATAFHTARSMQAGSKNADGVVAQNLVETSPASWAESDLKLKEPIEMNQGKDRQGPIALGAVATVRVPEPAPPPSPSASPSPAGAVGAAKKEEKKEEEEKKTPEGRVVAVGDVDFASNTFLGFPGNQDFFLNAVAWLAQDVDLISIRPREPDDQRMFLTETQRKATTYTALLGLPGAFVVLGVAAWWRRR